MAAHSFGLWRINSSWIFSGVSICEALKYHDRRDALYNEIFSQNGYADTDNDKVISRKEEAKACIEMGYSGPFFEFSNEYFCKPSLEELEDYIDHKKQKPDNDHH